MKNFLIMFVLLFFFAGCAGMQQYPTGIPASGAEKFFFHLEQEADARGLQISGTESRYIPLDGGSLNYSISETDGIVVIVNVKGAKEMSEAEISEKQAEMKAFSDELTEAARKRAEAANAFD